MAVEGDPTTTWGEVSIALLDAGMARGIDTAAIESGDVSRDEVEQVGDRYQAVVKETIANVQDAPNGCAL